MNLFQETEQAKDEGRQRGNEKQCGGGGTIQAKESADEQQDDQRANEQRTGGA